MTLVRLIGRHAAMVMLVGMVVIAFLPGISAVLRPFLPFLVSLLLGLGMARLDIGPALAELASPRRLVPLLGLVIIMSPLTCAALYGIGLAFGADDDTFLALIVFGAAPPLSSAAAMALLLGVNARITLQLGLLATIATPVLGPLCFYLVGIDVDIAPVTMAARIAVIMAGGFAIGFALQWIIGKARIAANAEAFNGIAALAMLVFLFPLLDGVGPFVAASPWTALGLLILSITLNFGGNIAVTALAGRVTNPATARALGLMFGNRNVSYYLAVLPANPALSLFIAAAQVPIYATPAVFQRRK